jgi:hypothetical protein
MSRDAELDALAVRLLQYADSPLLERHQEMRVDLRTAAEAVEDHAAILRTAGAARTAAALKTNL